MNAIKMNRILYIYALNGVIKCLSAEEIQETELLAAGWKHTATIDPALWIEAMANRRQEPSDMLDELQFSPANVYLWHRQNTAHKSMKLKSNIEEGETAQTTASLSVVHERLVHGSFAPAPWHIGELNPWLVYAADGYAVADLRTYHGMHADTKADARLIAAAPEMLEALERIREYQGRFGEDDPQSIAADMLAKISFVNSQDH